MGTFILCLAVSGLNPVDSVSKDEVDLVEVNHYYDGGGRRVFRQIIFYDWSAKQRRFNVRAWRLIRVESQLPQLDARRKRYVVRWQDGIHFRRVSARQYRRTWTQYDPEQFERRFLPKNRRSELVNKK